jgi:uncharacterized SAM-dependent methyltransferase
MLTKRQEFELITAIQGRGEIPLKFAYLGKGAQNWAKLSEKRQSGSDIHSVEMELLFKRLDTFLSSFKTKKINVIDLGCGDGYKAVKIITRAIEYGFEVRYVPVDISQSLIDIVYKKVKKAFPKIKIFPYVIDFELGNFSEISFTLSRDGYANLMLFLGTTLGNFDNANRILTNFRDSMTTSDYLIIGIEMTNFALIDKILERYKREREGDNFLSYIPRYIGFAPKQREIEFSWHEKLHQIQAHLLVNKDTNVKIGSEKFVIEKGEKILIVRSRKFTEQVITEVISEAGLRNEILTTTPTRSYLLTMVQPTRFNV